MTVLPDQLITRLPNPRGQGQAVSQTDILRTQRQRPTQSAVGVSARRILPRLHRILVYQHLGLAETLLNGVAYLLTQLMRFTQWQIAG